MGRPWGSPWSSLKAYHLLPSVRGDLLARLGRSAEARAEFERADGRPGPKQSRPHPPAVGHGLNRR